MRNETGLTLKPRIHGGLQEEELLHLGFVPEDILDLSASTNPYGPNPAVLEAIRNAPLTRYPDPSSFLARKTLGENLGVAPDHIILGNGATDLLWALARLLIKPHTLAMVVEPTFGEFRAAAEAAGGHVCEWRAQADQQFRIDLAAVTRLIFEHHPEVLYLCTPNTPTGIGIPARAIVDFAKEHRNLTILLDQSFLSLSEHHADTNVVFPANTVCIRSLTKDHGIPGIRIGYALGSPVLLQRLEGQRAAWSVSSPAQAAAQAAAHTQEFVEKSRVQLLADRERLVFGLQQTGYKVVPSVTSFVLVDTGNATQLRQKLLSQHQIMVRDTSSFGLPEHIRIAARPSPETQRLLTALRQEKA